MKIEVHEKQGAEGGSIYSVTNYTEGDGLYHFAREGILTCWERGAVQGQCYTMLGREKPEDREGNPRLPNGEKPLAVFGKEKDGD